MNAIKRMTNTLADIDWSKFLIDSVGILFKADRIQDGYILTQEIIFDKVEYDYPDSKLITFLLAEDCTNRKNLLIKRKAAYKIDTEDLDSLFYNNKHMFNIYDLHGKYIQYVIEIQKER